MASQYHNLSDYDSATMPDASEMRIGIVVSQWNNEVTGALLDGAINTLVANGVKQENIKVATVPGSFELIYGSSLMTQQPVDAVIAIGCVVRGDTPHFDYICQGTTYGIAHLNATQTKPVIYGLLTVNTMEQALERCGGRLGNKGDECAVTAIRMVDLKRSAKM